MKLKPLADKVVLKSVEVEEKTKGGLILTTASQEAPSFAEVIAVGPGGIVDGKEVAMTVNVGDKVVCNKYSMSSVVKIEDQEYSIVSIKDIYAVVEA